MPMIQCLFAVPSQAGKFAAAMPSRMSLAQFLAATKPSQGPKPKVMNHKAGNMLKNPWDFDSF